MEFSQLLASSDLVPADYKQKPANILVAIQWGQELGLQPLQALQNISVIGGRPSIWGDAALALCRADYRCIQVLEEVANDVATCRVKRRQSDGSVEEIERSFSAGDAKRAGLLNRKGPWQSYPQRMLQMRARGFALRDAFPDLLRGVITAEEARDTVDVEQAPPPENPLENLPAVEEVAEPEAVVEADAEPETSEWNVMNPADGSVLNACQTAQEFEAAFSGWIGKCRTASGPAAERRHKIAELKKGNAEAWDRLGSEKLEKEYKSAIRYLSVAAKETPDAGTNEEAS